MHMHLHVYKDIHTYVHIYKYVINIYSSYIGAGGGMVGCEGVTLLPPGSRWLTLALTCVSVDTRLFLYAYI
jgi:hypothetical protein